MSIETRLTTDDNPFDPFEDFKSWYFFDVEKGYNTCGKIARITNISDEMTQDEVFTETEKAMESLIMNDPIVSYKKVTRVVKDPQ